MVEMVIDLMNAENKTGKPSKGAAGKSRDEISKATI